jgi:hypothetical protein
LRFGKISAIILLGILCIPFGLHLFSFIDAHDLYVWSFDGLLSSVYSFYNFWVFSPSVLLFSFNIYFVFKLWDSVVFVLVFWSGFWLYFYLIYELCISRCLILFSEVFHIFILYSLHCVLAL